MVGLGRQQTSWVQGAYSDLTDAQACITVATVEIDVMNRMTNAIQKGQNCWGFRRSLHSWAQLTGGDRKTTS